MNANTVTASIPLPGSAEQPRFNPADGLIYPTIPSVGVLVFDPTAGTAGTGDLSRLHRSRAMSVTASFPNGIADANKELVISTTIGNEVVACGQANGRADCAGTLIGDPLIGGVTLLGNGGTVLAKGRIVLAK